jgi:hypothetical protein
MRVPCRSLSETTLGDPVPYAMKNVKDGGKRSRKLKKKKKKERKERDNVSKTAEKKGGKKNIQNRNGAFRGANSPVSSNLVLFLFFFFFFFSFFSYGECPR